jgi:hypothetical protein
MDGMTDQYLPPSPDQHDTAAYARPVPPMAAGPGAPAGYGPGYGTGYGPGAPAGGANPGWYVPGQAAPVGNPEAEYWAGRFRRQRTMTRVVAGVAALGAVLAIGIGVAAVQAVRDNPVAAAAERLGSALGQVPELGVPAPGEQGAAPEGAAPQEPDGMAPTTPDELDEQAIPLPEPLRGLGNALGITDARQLLDLAVANGLMSEADAEKLRAAIEAGQALQGLTGNDEATTDS